MKSVIVFGPQGCGKTLFAEQLARHFGLPKWIDYEPGITNLDKFKVGYLILCVDDPRNDVPFGDLLRRVYPFAQACKMAGIALPPELARRAAGSKR